MSRTDDRQRQMVTPEGIVLPLVLASRGSRFGALAIDLMLVSLLILATTIGLVSLAGGMLDMAGGPEARGAAARALEFLQIVWIAAMFLFRNAWFIAFELGPRGATPGKRLLGIRVAARDGGRLTAEMVIARNLLRDVELFLPLVFVMAASDGGDTGLAALAGAAWFLVFALFPLFNRDRLRAGDLIAGSWVVEAPRQRLQPVLSVAVTATAPASLADGLHRFSEAELAVYGEYELQTLERVLRENRAEALSAVHETICRKIGRQPLAGDARAFLDAYYAQLRARLEAGMRLGRRKADKHS